MCRVVAITLLILSSKNSDKSHFFAKILNRLTFKKMEYSVSASALPRVSSSVREVFSVAGLAPALGGGVVTWSNLLALFKVALSVVMHAL